MDLHKNPGWSVTGNLGISIGKKKIADEWPLYVDSYATWQSNGYLEISSELQIIGITTGVGLLSYTPPESEFYAEAWMDIYGGLFRGIVQLNARPKYFNGYFGMTVQIPEKIPVNAIIGIEDINILRKYCKLFFKQNLGLNKYLKKNKINKINFPKLENNFIKISPMLSINFI